MTDTPLPGCCMCCNEPVTQRQKSVLFEGPNLRYPGLGDDTAVFHTRSACMWDARGYDEAWAKAAEGREQKFPGWFGGEVMLRLIEATEGFDPAADDPGVPVCLHLTGGVYDGTRWDTTVPSRCQEVLYVEAVPQPRKAERGVWYVHAADCPCGAADSGSMSAGDHLCRAKPEPSL